MDQKKRLHMKTMLKELEGFRARHTELISVYIPSGYSIIGVAQQLSQELGTAENIKSKTTRQNVQSALEKMIRILKTYKSTPQNGLAVFSGNVSPQEGYSDFKTYAIEPPEPLNLRMYKCDQIFHIEPLKEILLPKKTYGLVVIDRQEGNVALLKGTIIVPVYNEESYVPGKSRAGGQSAQRFERIREGMASAFLKKVGDLATKVFRAEPNLAGIIVGGPGQTKEDFVSNHLPQDVKIKVIATKDVGYTGSQGIQELVQRSQDILAKEELIEEQQAVNHFLEVLNKRPKFAAYGKEQVNRALEMAAVGTLLISETIPEGDAEILAEKVEKTGGEWKMISNDSREGEQLTALGGLAAVLRFPIE